VVAISITPWRRSSGADEEQLIILRVTTARGSLVIRGGDA
jgi:hypothetical protein